MSEGRALYTNATIKTAKVTANYSGSFLVLGLELKLPRASAIMAFDDWSQLPDYKRRHPYDDARWQADDWDDNEPEEEAAEGEPKKASKPKRPTEAQKKAALEKEYTRYVEIGRAYNERVGASAQKAAIFLTLLDQEVVVAVSPVQGEMFLLDAPAQPGEGTPA